MAAETRGPVGQVMVIGAGIAGVQAALDLANSGFYVHLVETKPAIGGVMAQLDKTFPTNDCSMCIISPKSGGMRPASEHRDPHPVRSEGHWCAGELHGQRGERTSLRRSGQMHRLRRLRRGLPGAGARRVQPGAVGRQGGLSPLSPGDPRGLRHQEAGPGPVHPDLSGGDQCPGLCPADQAGQIRRSREAHHGAAAAARGPGPGLPPSLRSQMPPARSWTSRWRSAA